MKTLSMCMVMFLLSSAACSAYRDRAAGLQEAKTRSPNAQPQGGPNAEGLAQAQARDPDRSPDPPMPATDQPRQEGVPARRWEDVSRSIPDDAVATAAIDEGFQRWSASWMVNQYVSGSAIATDRGFKIDTYIVRGVFSFLRGSAKSTIPFAAAFTSSENAAEGFRLSNLCYNDNTSGATRTTECSDPSDRHGPQGAAQSREFLGRIVAFGLAQAMTSGGEICKKHYTAFGRPYMDCP